VVKAALGEHITERFIEAKEKEIEVLQRLRQPLGDRAVPRPVLSARRATRRHPLRPRRHPLLRVMRPAGATRLVPALRRRGIRSASSPTPPAARGGPSRTSRRMGIASPPTTS
jgi:hypothetical protein